MSKEYSAFISYRHAPADSAAAEEIQKRLERYPVPAAIRKKTGKEKVGKIFRDKEELPITSDLNEDISAALEDADYLIVICSTSTKESIWVEREIEYFLKNHSKKQILTVLVSGEPYDVIPEILLQDTVRRTAPDGTTYEETVNYEPLSCDFRPGIRASRRTEIPRLAAALLGCKYDELVMRERQYRRRRLTVILSVTGTLAAIALAYLLWSRAEIRKNYEESQRNYNQALLNQSEFLSGESGDLLDDGDRLRAIELAMEALPSAENDRPLSPKAEEALAVALNAYFPPETADYRNAMAEIAEYRTDGTIQCMEKTEDGKYLLALDAYGIVYVWDIDAKEKVFEIRSAGEDDASAAGPDAGQEAGLTSTLNEMKAMLEEHGDELPPEKREELEDTIRALTDAMEDLEENISAVNEFGGKAFSDMAQYGFASVSRGVQSMTLLNDRMIAVKTSGGVSVYDFVTGSRLWSYKNKDVYWYNARLDASGDGSTVFILWSQFTGSSENPVPCTLHVVAADAETGDVIDESSITAEWNDTAYIHGSAASEDGGALAFAAGLSQSEIAYGSIFIYRKEDGTIRTVPTGERFTQIHEIDFYDDTHFAVAGYPEYTQYSSGGAVGMLGIMTTIRDFPINVFCVDAETGSILSDGSFMSPQINYMPENEGLCFINETNDTRVICMYANKLAVFSANTGEKLDEVEFTGAIVRGGVSDKKKVNCYLKNGNIAVYDPAVKKEQNEMTYFPFENYGMQSVLRPGEDDTVRYLVAAEPNTIRMYDTVYDQEFTEFGNSILPGNETIVGMDVIGDSLFLLGSESAAYIQDLNGETALRKIELPGGPNKYTYLGKDANHPAVWIEDKSESENDTLRISLPDGEVTPVSLAGGAYATYRFQRDGRLSYLSRKKVTLLDTSGENPAQPDVIFTVTVGEVNRRFFVNPSGTKIVVSKEEFTSGKGFRAFVTDVSTEEQEELDIAMKDNVRLADWNEKEDRMAVTDGYSVFLFDGDGVPVTELSETGQQVVNFTFYQGSLFVLYSGGHLTRYTEQTGALEGRTVLRHYVTEPFMDNTKWTFGEDTLYLTRSDTIRSILSFVDLETWEEPCAVSDSYGYDAVRDRILFGGKDRTTGDRRLGYFKHYTAEDLIRKGKEALGSFRMSEEERAMYGLS